MDVRINPGDMLPMREVESQRIQGRPQFHQSHDTAHLLQGEHIRAGFPSFIILPSSFPQHAAPRRGVIEIVFNIASGDAKGFCPANVLPSVFFTLPSSLPLWCRQCREWTPALPR